MTLRDNPGMPEQIYCKHQTKLNPFNSVFLIELGLIRFLFIRHSVSALHDRFRHLWMIGRIPIFTGCDEILLLLIISGFKISQLTCSKYHHKYFYIHRLTGISIWYLQLLPGIINILLLTWFMLNVLHHFTNLKPDKIVPFELWQSVAVRMLYNIFLP